MFVSHGNGEASDRQAGGLTGGAQFHGGLQEGSKFSAPVADVGKTSDFLEQFEQLKFLSHR